MKTRKQYESEIDHLRQTIDEKKYQIRHLLDLQKGSNIDVDLTSIPSKKEVKDLKQTLADTQRQLEDWIAKAKSLETKLTDSDTQLTLYRETVDTTRLAYRSELSKGTSNVSDLTAKIESLESIISQLTLESSDYKKQHESDSNRIRELTSLLHHRDVALITAQEEIQQNKSKYDLSLKSLKESALKDQSKIIGEQKAAYEKQIQSLNSSLVKANAKIAELAEANKQQEIQLRQRSGSDSYNLKDYLIFAQGEINSLNKQLASANERIQQLQEAAVINSSSSSSGGGSNRQSLSHSSTTGTEGLDNRSTLSSSHSEADRIAAAAAAALKFNQKGSFSESNYSAEGSAQSIAQKGSVHSLSSQGEEYFYALDQLPEDQYPSNMYTTFRGPSHQQQQQDFEGKERTAHRPRRSRQLIRIELKQGEEPEQAILSSRSRQTAATQHVKSKSISSNMSSNLSDSGSASGIISGISGSGSLHGMSGSSVRSGQPMNLQPHHQYRQQIEQHVQQQVQQHILQQQQQLMEAELDRQKHGKPTSKFT
eukprot:gene20286-20867_t